MNSVLCVQHEPGVLSGSQLILLKDRTRNQNIIVSLRANRTLNLGTLVLRQQEAIEIVLVLLLVGLHREVRRHVEIYDTSATILHRASATRVVLGQLDVNGAEGRLHR